MSSHHRYSFDSDPGETEPLDNPNNNAYAARQPQARTKRRDSRSSNNQHNHHNYHQRQQSNQSSPTRSPQKKRPPQHAQPQPSDYPRSERDRSASRRRQSRHEKRNSDSHGRTVPASTTAAGLDAGVKTGGEVEGAASVPPSSRKNKRQSQGNRSKTRQAAAAASPARPLSGDNITPGADNSSQAAAGGTPALAYTIAEKKPRGSGVGAMSGYDHQQPYPPQQPYPQQAYQRSPPQSQSAPYEQHTEYGYEPYSNNDGYDHVGYDPSAGYGYAGGHAAAYDASSHSSHSLAPMGSTAGASGTATPTRSHHSYQSHSSDPFGDPHSVYSQRMDPSLGNLHINPNEIDDDGDDGLDYRRRTRNSMLSMGRSNNNGGAGAAAAGAAGGAAAAGLMGRNRNSQMEYNPVASGGSGGGGYDLANRAEKPADWMAKHDSRKKRRKWFVIILVGLIIIGAIVGVVVGTIVNQNKKGNDTPSGQTAEDDAVQNGDLNRNSAEIKKLMDNPDLHKVFPGVDYTPINVQYPDCLKNPPSQNNVTRDVAVLSQLTSTIRLYGTDCNQTQMTIHALNQLELKDDIKIWMGVWQDGNKTTNKRQLEQMWTILDEYGSSYFEGVIVANEILFREEMTVSDLGDLLDTVRKNLTEHNWDLPVATSDLGDDWTSSLADVSDYIMANIHPFFAGVNAKEAAGWTYSFWQNQNSGFFKKETKKNIISEVGWPTKGGTNCGSDSVTDCPNGSVAGVDELNQLLDDWVCQALDNGTNYFWFEMFDEPWKIAFNEKGKEWEDQWGIMDVDRNLKPGVKIPDCGGKTV